MPRHHEQCSRRLLPFIRYGTFMWTGTTQLIPALRSEPMFLQQTLPCLLVLMRKGSSPETACLN